MASKNDKDEAPDQSVAGRKAEEKRQKAVVDAVAKANADELPKLGGNTWEPEQ